MAELIPYKFYRLVIEPDKPPRGRSMKRSWIVDVELERPGVIASVHADLRNAAVTFFGEPGIKIISAVLKYGYRNKNGKFVTVYSVPVRSLEMKGLLLAHLRKYDIVLAIDCSRTVRILNNNIIAAGVVKLEFLDADDGSVLVNQRPIGFEIWNPSEDVHPEKVAWVAVLDYLASDTWKIGKKLAMITDHDLALHTEINARVSPLFHNFLLPDNVSILYAKDQGGESINSTISDCDRLANLMLDLISSGEYPQNELHETPRAPFSHLRVWRESYIESLGV